MRKSTLLYIKPRYPPLIIFNYVPTTVNVISFCTSHIKSLMMATF